MDQFDSNSDIQERRPPVYNAEDYILGLRKFRFFIWCLISIDVRKGVLGGLTPSLRLKIWAGPPLLESFRAGDPLEQLLGGLGGR